MRLRLRLLPARVSAVTAALAATGVLALSATPASAADTVSATLRVTIHQGDSVYTQINGTNTCHQGFTVGQAKDIPVTVNAGQYIQVFSSHSCYDAIIIGGVTINSDQDQQVIEISL